MKSLITYGILGSLFLAAGIWMGAHNASATPGADQPLYTAALTDMDGKPVDLSKLKGQRVLVNFWATWCKPCVQEMPELSNLQTDASRKNIQIVGIGIDSAENIKEFSAKYHIAYPVYVGGMTGSELLRKYGDTAGGLPFTVLISADGQVEKTYLARLKMDELRKDLKL